MSAIRGRRSQGATGRSSYRSIMWRNMPVVSLLIGGLLIALGVVGYVIALATAEPGNDYASWTALIPAVPGLLLVICGLIGRTGEKARKHAMHAAVLIALLGALAPVGRLPKTLGADDVNLLAAGSMIGMLLLCVAFVVLGVQSFIAARKARKEQQGFPVEPA